MSEQQHQPTIHPVGRFNVRVVPAPHPLYSGRDHNFSRERHDYERGTILELFDAAHPHTTAGQFVSAYSVETIAALAPGTLLDLHGGIPAWTMTVEETATLIAIARAA
jgi:hypothetical protein